jgi:hypothetical protein
MTRIGGSLLRRPKTSRAHQHLPQPYRNNAGTGQYAADNLRYETSKIPCKIPNFRTYEEGLEPGVVAIRKSITVVVGVVDCSLVRRAWKLERAAKEGFRAAGTDRGS